MKLLTKHVYSEWNRDDFVENDACLDQTIEDTLVNKTWVFISARAGRGNSVSYSATHNVKRSLVHVACMPDPRSRADACPAGWSSFIPFKWSACGGKTNISSSIFRIGSKPGKGDVGFRSGTHEDVWLVWTGSGEFPGRVPSGVRVVTAAEGEVKLWEAARAKWLCQHGCKTNAKGEVTSCSMTGTGGGPIDPPPPPPPAKGFPLALSKSSPAATTTVKVEVETLTVRIPMRLQRRGGRKLIITPEGAAVPAPKPRRDNTLIKALVRAHRWRRRIESG